MYTGVSPKSTIGKRKEWIAINNAKIPKVIGSNNLPSTAIDVKDIITRKNCPTSGYDKFLKTKINPD